MADTDDTSAQDALFQAGPDHDDEQPGKDDKPEKAERKERPGRAERNFSRVFKVIDDLKKEIREGGASKELIARLDRLEKGQGEIRKTADPKPKLASFEDAEEFATALEEWHDRNPKSAEKKDDDKGGKGKDESVRNATPDFTTESLAAALSVTLDELEDFQEAQEEAREEHEDYDEVMTAGKDLPRKPLMTRCLILADDGAEINYWLVKNDKKTFRRIAALESKKDVTKALDEVRERMEESDDDAPEKSDEKNNRVKPLGGKTPPRSKAKDASTESWEVFEARRKKELRGG